MSFDRSHPVGRMLLATLVATAILPGPAALASDDDRAPTPAGIASLDDALAAVQRVHPGRVLKVELESEDDGPAAWVYEVKLLTRAGHVLEVELDAVSLDIVGVEGGRPGRPRDPDDD